MEKPKKRWMVLGGMIIVVLIVGRILANSIARGMGVRSSILSLKGACKGYVEWGGITVGTMVLSWESRFDAQVNPSWRCCNPPGVLSWTY